MARRAKLLRLATAGPQDTAALAAAIDRGEISSDVDIERLCLIGPAMVAYRTLMLRTR